MVTGILINPNNPIGIVAIFNYFQLILSTNFQNFPIKFP